MLLLNYYIYICILEHFGSACSTGDGKTPHPTHLTSFCHAKPLGNLFLFQLKKKPDPEAMREL